MIFYTLRQWLALWADLAMWLWTKPQPHALKESSEGRICAEIETGRVWRVRHLATFWAARTYGKSSFKIGDYVKVVERKGLILFIEPAESLEQQE